MNRNGTAKGRIAAFAVLLPALLLSDLVRDDETG
jgi:hypothetical protein